jgi:hypothetical protein
MVIGGNLYTIKMHNISQAQAWPWKHLELISLRGLDCIPQRIVHLYS